jgi:hydroxymethylbilane synthase
MTAFELPPYHPPVPHNSTATCPVASSSSNPEANHLADLARLKANALKVAGGAPMATTGKDVFTLGTRMSKLAMVQTNLVKEQLEARWPGTEIRIFGMVSRH